MPLFGRGKRGTTIFFATDVHGSERTWRKFLNAAKFYGADVLIMGGDVMGKLAIPIIHEGKGTWRATIHGRVERVTDEDGIEALRARIANLGFYDVRMELDEYAATKDDADAVEALFVRLATERIERWIDLAETRLAGTGVRCYATGGNDDLTEVMATMDRTDTQAFVACEDRAVPIDDDHLMISMPYVNPTPWRTPREAEEDDLAKRIATLAEPIGDHRNVIFNFHAPPKDSTLDTCAQLDASTDPPSQVVVAGQPLLYGAGSTAIRDAIERWQPVLGLHGHIHESQATARLGRTLCVNPGSEYGEGVLRGCLLTVADGKVSNFQMTTG